MAESQTETLSTRLTDVLDHVPGIYASLRFVRRLCIQRAHRTVCIGWLCADNYGQLMFSWDSPYYDGMLARNIPFKIMVRAKLLLLQASCVVLFVISLPLFAWFRPDLIPLHMAFLFYNAGITTVLVMELATRNSSAVDVERSGSFFNYEGFSVRHWLWFLPTALPPSLFMASMSTSPALGLSILAGLGFVSLAFTDAWTRFFAKGLRHRKYTMATGFRSHAS